MKTIHALALGLTLVACGGEATPPAASPTSPATSPSSATSPTNEAMPVPTPELRAIVDAPDRDPADRSLDGGRKPAELLTFIGLKPGMKVAELGATRGYTTELLARAVGPSGVVYGQNNPWMLEKFAQKPWSERLAKPVNKNVVSVTREFDDPLPPEAKDLDAVVCILLYHDTVWLKADRDKMNAAVFRALKPGGVYVVVDHSARAGAGASEANTTHRIEESFVKSEIEKAGFRLAEEGGFYREPSDARDWNPSPNVAGARRGHSDRFALKFVKP